VKVGKKVDDEILYAILTYDERKPKSTVKYSHLMVKERK
jgi:hypothetical protein